MEAMKRLDRNDETLSKLSLLECGMGMPEV
jgi:hypothetical protein